MKTLPVLCASVLAALAGTVRAQPDLVTNGGFETGDFTGWTQFGDTSFTLVYTGSFDGVSPHGGTYAGYFGPTLAGGGGIQQNLTTTVGQQVLVDFWYQAQGASNSFLATLDGQTLVSFTNDTSHTTWTEFSFLVTVASTNPLLQFTFLNPPDYDFLDDVHVYSGGFGACCMGDGTCSTLTSAGCAGASGVYEGDGSSCASTTCPQGACCLGNGSCITSNANGCISHNGVYHGNASACGSVTCTPTVWVTVPLTWNFNGMVHGAAEEGTTNLNNPNGYRSVADRGLLVDGSAGTINAGPIVDPDSMPFTLVSQAGQLDIVCLGDRRYVANAARAWGTGTQNGLQPSWLPNSDLTGPQISIVSSLGAVFTAQTSLGVLYQISDGGGHFTMTLNFSDASPATVTLAGPDWYGDHAPPAPGAGVAAQRELGVYTATGSADLAAADNPLNVAEAVVNVNSLLAAGLGNYTGKHLTSIAFANPISNTTTYANSTPANASGFAIIAATLGGVSTQSACYANCDNSTTPPILNVLDFGCFLNRFAAGDSYANCDGSTVPPVLNVLDFGCFLNRFAAGCS